MSGEAKPWAPPNSDMEFQYTGPDSIPGWGDKGWASYSNGPAVAVPAGDVYGKPPYTTLVARVGDTVKFVAATPARGAHFEIIAGEPTGENGTIKIPQVSGASLEDMLKGGTMSPDDLGDDAKGQILGRSPELRQLIEEGAGAPEAVPVGDVVKVA